MGAWLKRGMALIVEGNDLSFPKVGYQNNISIPIPHPQAMFFISFPFPFPHLHAPKQSTYLRESITDSNNIFTKDP